MRLSILYRGPLASCNYGCAYCPFAKHAETAAERAEDTNALERFVGWVESRRGDHISVLFTPWGEALTRVRYRRALVRLTGMPHVEKAAIQTNLSCRLDWVEDCDKSKLGLWTTYHPSEVARTRFLARCFELSRRGVRFSVGVVGLKEHAGEIEALRRELPPDVYLWINAFKRVAGYYGSEDLERFEAVDPLFHINNRHHPSRGRACLCGESVISVAGDGTVRRCHFIREPIGNIYEQGFEESLRARACTNGTCGCHIGYVHMPGLDLYSVFGSGVLERAPEKFMR
ncbi:MAG TPA: STM4011 family radical SAM protein [Pyrinomonadaceae bacterium]|nr:STM4011 family radical SAM protein [Pyrinomonadaceae bacterium]